MKENVKVLSVDWLQLFGYFTGGQVDYSRLPELGYSVERQPKGTKQFKSWDRIMCIKSGLMVFELTYEPYSVRGRTEGGIYKHNACILRVDNRVCYSSALFDIVKSIATTIGFACSSVSRIDLCMDFHVFDNGLRPENLIRKYYTGEYLKHGYTKALGFGTQYNEYMPETLSFKGKNSAVSVKLYDKTKEMKDVKTKPHIEALWRSAGLDSNKRIWRLELAIKSDAKRIVARETGEYVELTIDYLSDYNNLQKLFYSFIDVYFKWHVRTAGKKKCQCPVLRLFETGMLERDLRRHYISSLHGVGRKYRRIDAILKEAYKCCNGDWDALATIDRMYSILFDNYENIWSPEETTVVLLQKADGRHEIQEVVNSCLQSIDENLIASIEKERVVI